MYKSQSLENSDIYFISLVLIKIFVIFIDIDDVLNYELPTSDVMRILLNFLRDNS